MPAPLTNATAIDTARSFFEAYNSHDVNRMLTFCADNAQVRYVPMGNQVEGKAWEVGKKFWSGLIDAFPDLRVVVDSIFGDGRNIAAEVVIGGTQRKDFLQIPNQGKHFDLPHAFLLQVDNGSLITSITAYWDNASFYRQVGKTTLDS
jgi:steroid delta-isomerase-like uncharacterized protein